MPSMVFGVFLRTIYTFKTLNCTVAYGLWGDFWHLGGHGPLGPLKSAYGYGFNPPAPNYDEKNVCPSVSVFHISVQWSFNVDQFMQTFDS